MPKCRPSQWTKQQPQFKLKPVLDMNEPSEKQVRTTRAKNEEASTFQSIFFRGDIAVPIRVPDYQRAFSWEQKQIELFLGDLRDQADGNEYYFGHFIAEDTGPQWEIVDGQQRITTFVLFLMVCRVLSPLDAIANNAYSLIESFSTVSYDLKALKTICGNLKTFLEKNGHFDERKQPTDDQIIAALMLPKENFTRSQRRMVLALLRFNQAFQNKKLEQDKIGNYIAVIMSAECSLHLPKKKSVAVNIFELHNTRGVPLTTLEKVKAKLMKFVYDQSGDVEKIQDEFGQIYGMEERLAANSFRGELEMERLLRLHLMVVDDGNKKTKEQFSFPHANDTADNLVEYVDSRLNFMDREKTTRKEPKDGVKYALNLAKEFKKSVRIVSNILPEWDNENPSENRLVGDVLILDQDLSCQFFLIVCRRFESAQDKADGRIGNDSLLLWERLLFTRDFHDRYHGLWYKDDFQKLFESCRAEGVPIIDTIRGYLVNGFRTGHTDGLQSIVVAYLNEHRESVLHHAFYWWKSKMIYAIYKYEISRMADIREVMKGTISVEHILPQEWNWEWVVDSCGVPKTLSSEDKDKWIKDVGSFINGIGNLLLITPSENTSVGNNHPAKKEYSYTGGSYEEHNRNREKWNSSNEWSKLIRERGEKIFKFMLENLVDTPEKPTSP